MAVGGISYYLHNQFINHVLRNAPISSGSQTWVALYTSNPTAADTGTEVSFTNSYARAYCKQNSYSGSPFDIGPAMYAYNKYEITFPTPTGTWGNVTHWGLRDAPTGGNLYFYGPLASGSGIITEGNRLFLPPYTLQLYYREWYLSSRLLKHVLNNVSYTSPGSSVYGALYFDMPSTDGTGGTEVGAGLGYSRQQMVNWLSPVSGSTYNVSGSIVFCSSATQDWGQTVEGMCLRDAPVGGNLLFPFYIDPGAGGVVNIYQYDKFVIDENVATLYLYESTVGAT